MTAAFAAIRPGLSCLDVIAEGGYTMLKAGAEDATMAPAVGEGTFYLDSAENPRRIIREGDMIFIDMAIHVRGYLGDMTRAGIVGEGTQEQRGIIETVQRAYRTGAEYVLEPTERIFTVRSWLTLPNEVGKNITCIT